MRRPGQAWDDSNYDPLPLHGREESMVEHLYQEKRGGRYIAHERWMTRCLMKYIDAAVDHGVDSPEALAAEEGNAQEVSRKIQTVRNIIRQIENGADEDFNKRQEKLS